MTGQPEKGSNPWIGVDCTNFKVADPADPLGPSHLIIPAGTNFEVSVDFDFDGMLANWLMGTEIPYRVTYYYDLIGGSQEGELGAKTGSTIAGKVLYTDADTKVTASLPDPGTYRLTAIVTFTGPPVTAFTEGPMIQIS